MLNEIFLKNVATYDDSGTCLNNLKEINFIYGANGSGKTTVSNFIHNPQDIKYQQCSVKWKDGLIVDTMVYNKTFKETNFNSSNHIKGVFTLGQATDDDIKIIDKKKEQLEIVKVQGTGYKKKLEELQGSPEKLGKIQVLENEFKEFCWAKIYKLYEDAFKEAFKGSLQKQTFRDKILSEFVNNQVAILSIDELKEKSQTIFGETPQILNHISTISYEELNNIEIEDIWNKKIIGKADVDIAKLIQHLNINDWVNQGKDYLQDDNICPFCQQETITDDFKLQLEKYFDTTYVDSINKIKIYQQNYDLQSTNIIEQLNYIEREQKQNSNSKLDIEKFSIYIKTLVSQINSNKEVLKSKLKEPSRTLELTSTKEQFENIKAVIDSANEEIKKHNKIVENYQIEKTNLICAIWKFLVKSFEDEIKEYTKKYKGLEKGIDSLTIQYNKKRQEYRELSQEIKYLEKNVTSVQPTIDEINKLLKYYGFLNFEIEPSQTEANQYQIKREDGTLAQETLSEGEITFITFLYYYQLTKGAVKEDEVSKDRILIIDDPISSLDSNILFVVSTLLKKIINDVRDGIGNIKQVIILTHNVYFHKEVSFIDGRDTGKRNDTHFWILRKNNKVSKFYPYDTNPIKTSYELLWQELKDKEKSSNITLQNTMRRIIENYFKILGNFSDDKLIDNFEEYEEQVICRSLISWINDGSHSVSDDLYVESQDDIIDKYIDVFEKIFKFTNHEGHYKMMMGINE
ncbi:MAG: AAA family ATPase [Arcobacter sp.]|uniref:AAA family ATPase n=1 Tax=Arcobacter sp. TaxID=1872629 RepID=UPI00258C923D|nr:AAA family ATPase [Arcobacter sp.]MDD3009647.1 AAA family ATPase [Arcobacter sp.]